MTVPAPKPASSLAPWIVLGPAFLLTGVFLGLWLRSGGAGAVWSEPAPVSVEPLRRVGMPSLAPIIDRVRRGVVGVHVRRRADAGLAEASPGEMHAGSTGVANGTGFVIHADGLIVTNEHVVRDAGETLVDVPEAGRYRAEVVGLDPVTDVAVLRLVSPPEELCVLELGDSSTVQQGDWVATVGNPYEFFQSVTAGVVSYVGRHLPQQGVRITNEFLQFSAPVNPGNSGGPVLDMLGHVVGITTRTHVAARGISFAVPSKVLKWVLDRMERDGGVVRRGFLGLELEQVDQATAKSLDLEPGSGAFVVGVQPETPAARAGLAPGDVVVGYDGETVTDPYALYDWITYSRPGEAATLSVLRGRTPLDPVRVVLGEVRIHPQPDEPDPIDPVDADGETGDGDLAR